MDISAVFHTGFDFESYLQKLGDDGIHPVIKHRVFYTVKKAHNARHDEDVYYRRSIVEAISFFEASVR